MFQVRIIRTAVDQGHEIRVSDHTVDFDTEEQALFKVRDIFSAARHCSNMDPVINLIDHVKLERIFANGEAYTEAYVVKN